MRSLLELSGMYELRQLPCLPKQPGVTALTGMALMKGVPALPWVAVLQDEWALGNSKRI